MACRCSCLGIACDAVVLLFIHLALLSSSQDVADELKSGGCTITARRCTNFPELAQSQFRDTLGEEELRAASVPEACLKRAEDFHYWCGNTAAGDEAGAAAVADVAATHDATATTQVFHSAACDRGWSLWDRFCYRHIWENKNWAESEAACRDEHNSHLVSVHSAAENSFCHELTYGLSAWIGYTDVNKDTHYEWSDSTQDDFSNLAKNCTGREGEPDCTKEAAAQQWYSSKGDKKLTFVCKRNARLPVALLTNVSAAELIQDWTKYAAAVSALPARAATTLPELKSPDIPQVPIAKFAGQLDSRPPVAKPMALKLKTPGLL